MDEDKDNIEKLAEHLIKMEYKAVRSRRHQNETQTMTERKIKPAVEKKVPSSNY